MAPKAVIQTQKSIYEWRIRMFRPTDMDPRIKGVISYYMFYISVFNELFECSIFSVLNHVLNTNIL